VDELLAHYNQSIPREELSRFEHVLASSCYDLWNLTHKSVVMRCYYGIWDDYTRLCKPVTAAEALQFYWRHLNSSSISRLGPQGLLERVI